MNDWKRSAKGRAVTVKMPATMRELARTMLDHPDGMEEPRVLRRAPNQTEYALSGEALTAAIESL